MARDREIAEASASGVGKELCEKCGEIVLGMERLAIRAQCLCDVCLHTKVLKKFKQACTQYALVRPGDSVLLALSGGAGSRAMLGMIREGQPFPRDPSAFTRVAVAHLIDEHRGSEKCTVAGACCREAAAECGLEYFEESLIGEAEASASVLESLGDASDFEDIRRTQRRRRLLLMAHAHGFTKVMLGDTADAIAARALELLCKGRGSEIVAEGGYVDDRFASAEDAHQMPFGVALVRPMRDVLQAEAAADCCARGFSFIREPLPSSMMKGGTELKDAGTLGDLSRAFISHQFHRQGAMAPLTLLRMVSRLKAHSFTLPLLTPARPPIERPQSVMEEHGEVAASRVQQIRAENLCCVCDAPTELQSPIERVVCDACARMVEKATGSAANYFKVNSEGAGSWLQNSVGEFLL